MVDRSKSSRTIAPLSDKVAKRTAIADIMLSQGLNDLGLRGLAAHLGTSDRMLLYYFSTKDQLVFDALQRISQRLAVFLNDEALDGRVTPGQFLASIFARADTADIAPFMRLWTDVIARAARGERPYDQIGATVVQSWIVWIDSRLVPPKNSVEDGRAVAILAIVEGLSLLELSTPGTVAQARPYLVRMLDALE